MSRLEAEKVGKLAAIRSARRHYNSCPFRFPFVVHLSSRPIQTAGSPSAALRGPIIAVGNPFTTARFQVSAGSEPFPLIAHPMANSFSQTYAPEIVEGTAHVAGYLLGRSLVDGIRSIFNTGGHVDKGDSYMDQSRDLLERHLQLLNLKQQNRILTEYIKLQGVKEDLEDPSGSVIKRHLAARKYRRWSKKTYKVIKRASDRARDDRFLDQIAAATLGPGNSSGVGLGDNPGTASTLTDPFSDSHAMSMLTDVAVNDLDQVEMSTYQSEDTRDAAIVWNLHNRDASTQHLVATVSTEVFSGDRTDSEGSQSASPRAPAALSLHKEDGSTPNLVVTSFNVSTYQRTDEAETRTISTVDQVEVFNPPEGH